jgi:polyisoprenoid-binding protein YceI
MALERWNIDPAHSILGFHARHLMIANVHGRFDRFEGAIDFDPDQPTESRVAVMIDAASIETRELQRDVHLRSPEFLDVERFPQITFHCTRVERLTLDGYEVVGDLTIRGITRSVTLDVSRSGVIEDHAGNRRVGFAVSGAISRKDFGLTWNRVLETGGVVVGDRVTLAIELEAVRVPEFRQMPEPAAAK